MISGHQEFFFLAIWWAEYFFLFFFHKLSITSVLHAIFFFRQALSWIDANKRVVHDTCAEIKFVVMYLPRKVV